MKTSVIFILVFTLMLPCYSQAARQERKPDIAISKSPGKDLILRKLKGHRKSVFSVAISPDGKTVATGSADKTITLWDTATGESIMTLKGHRHVVWAVAFSPDSSMLASGSRDRTIIIWDVRTGEKIKQIKKHRHTVTAVAFSPDGSLLATASADQSVILWDTSTWRLVKYLKGHRHQVFALAFSPDGAVLASGSRDKTIILWDVSKKEKIRTLKGHSHIVQSVAFSPDGKVLASGSRDRTIILWDVQTGGKINTLKGHKSTVNTVAFSPDGRVLVSGGRDKTVMVWNPDTGSVLDVFKAKNVVMSVAMSRAAGSIMASGSADGKVILWDMGKYLGGAGTVYARTPATKKQGPASYTPAPLTPPVMEAPELSYTVKIEDSNNDGIFDGGEVVKVTVKINNKGAGTAEDVKVLLSGNSTLIACLGSRKLVGKIESKSEKDVTIKCLMPTRLKAETGRLSIELSEQRGYAPTEIKSFSMAVKPADIRETQYVLSQLIDVDILPSRNKGYERNNSYALVIGISNYRDKLIPKVKYAKSDAVTVARYLENIGGIPRKNIKIITDEMVTRGDLEAYIEYWLPRRINKDSSVFIYYAGHGTPDPASGDAFIVPYDGHPDYKSKLYPLKRLYASLNKLPSEQVVVMLDSCFSGAGERSITSPGARPLSISVENPMLAGGNVFVLAASSGTQISSDFDKVKHGLFTYYLLKGMKGDADENKDGTVELHELYNFVKKHVSETASIELNRDQTPVLLPDLHKKDMKRIEITRTK